MAGQIDGNTHSLLQYLNTIFPVNKIPKDILLNFTIQHSPSGYINNMRKNCIFCFPTTFCKECIAIILRGWVKLIASKQYFYLTYYLVNQLQTTVAKTLQVFIKLCQRLNHFENFLGPILLEKELSICESVQMLNISMI